MEPSRRCASGLDGLVRLEVDGIACVAYPRLTGEVEEGDEVLVNEQARLLELGSGGFDVLYANLTRGLGLAAEEGAHVMALPYTPGQSRVATSRRTASSPDSLEGLPVVLCTLHSQVAARLRGARRGMRVAYVQVGGGALPVSLSDTVRALQERGLLEIAVAVAPCVGRRCRAASASPPRSPGRAAQGYDAVVCSVGPGIVGTGTRLGHGAARAGGRGERGAGTRRPAGARRPHLRGRPRERHRGVSHHTRAVLELVPRRRSSVG